MHIKLTNGVPAKYTLGQLRRDNPNTSFPKQIPDEMLASYDVYAYTVPAQPTYDRYTQVCVEGTFEQDAEGNWSLPWAIENQPQEQAGNNIRRKRDRDLQECDWVVIKNTETGTALPTEWVTYRQALRDITAQEGFPYSVTWPTKP